MNLWQRMNFHRVVWAPPEEGAGAGDGGDGEAASSSEGEGESGAGAGSQPSSIMDFASKGEDKGDGGERYALPEGIEVADHLVGTDAEDTLRKLATAYKGARQELSTRGKGDGEGPEGAVPENIEGYEITSEDAEDPVFKDLTSEASKPIVDAWRKAALDTGIPDAAFSKFMQAGVANMMADGLELNVDPEKQAEINGEAEMEVLTKDLGQAGADQALRVMDNFAAKMAERGHLRDEADVAEFSQMVGTARAVQIMQRILVGELGESPIPPADPVEGALTREEASAMHSEALKMEHGAARDDAIKKAEAAMAKALASTPSTTGAVRSRVLS